ncbi:MAG TPA: hypothetical protein VKR06_09100 [Ktedonosporobacter sp.]|nr:hypothetical protein [Ktedonosporobacter sp.]
MSEMRIERALRPCLAEPVRKRFENTEQFEREPTSRGGSGRASPVAPAMTNGNAPAVPERSWEEQRCAGTGRAGSLWISRR